MISNNVNWVFHGNRLSERIIKRQAGEEFLATGPPECRTELSPLGCTPAVQN